MFVTICHNYSCSPSLLPFFLKYFLPCSPTSTRNTGLNRIPSLSWGVLSSPIYWVPSMCQALRLNHWAPTTIHCNTHYTHFIFEETTTQNRKVVWHSQHHTISNWQSWNWSSNLTDSKSSVLSTLSPSYHKAAIARFWKEKEAAVHDGSQHNGK